MQTTSLTFKIDIDGGTADILPVSEQMCFRNMDEIFILDILNDLIFDLHRQYAEQHKKTFDISRLKCLNDNTA